MTKTKGTKEWSDSNINFAYGCSNGCIYCYARGMAKRFRPDKYENWTTMSLNWTAITKRYRKRKGRIMFPTSHDITPAILEYSLLVLKTLVNAGNNILVTTKPNPSVIKTICNELDNWKDQIQFRFTMTSYSKDRSLEWEPNAPLPAERLIALIYAYQHKWKTSVSIEPYLDPIRFIPDWIVTIQPFVNETIWIGIMNRRFIPKELWEKEKWGDEAVRLLATLIKTDKRIHANKIRFKDSIRNILFKDDSFSEMISQWV